MKIDFEADAASLGISVERYRKARRSLLSQMAYNRKAKPTPTPLACHGGPYDGAVIMLTTGSTARLNIDGQVGYYAATGEWKP